MAKSKEQYIAERTDDFDTDVYTFDLVDAHTVERLARDGDIKLPYKELDPEKDIRWNTKQFASRLLQGILNGDPIPNIANNLLDVVGYNEASAMRNARTMTTAAENIGRQDSYEELADKGVVQKKVWIATPDDRTRASHLAIDGEEIDIDDTFSNGCRYPADPNCSDGSEIWNCRCSMRDRIVGFRRADGSISYVGRERDTTMHAGQIAAEQAKRAKEAKAGLAKPKAGMKKEFSFIPAATKEEAERFISQFVDSSKFAATGVNYTGVDVDVQNEINKTLAELQETYDVPAFGGITAPAGNTKEGKMLSGATAAYSPIRDSFYLNRSSLKNMAVAEKTLKAEAQAIKDIYAHPEKYDLSKMSAAGRRVIENGRESGRATVPQSVQEVIWHEYGHRLEKFMPKDDLEAVYERMGDYASKISGYACENKSEYIAESFCCFNNGEKDKIDPVLARIFEGMKK